MATYHLQLASQMLEDSPAHCQTIIAGNCTVTYDNKEVKEIPNQLRRHVANGLWRFLLI